MSVIEIKEAIRVAESTGDKATAESLKAELSSMSING